MSARTPDFYIGISTQNPPTIISIGQTIDGMEEIEVRLDQPDEDKLNVFKEKIDKIVAPMEESVVAPVPMEESVVAPVPIEEQVVAPVPIEEQVVAPVPIEEKVVAPVPIEEKVVAPVPIEEKVAPEPVYILPLPPANDSQEQLPPTPPIIETCNATERDIIPSEDCNPNTQKPKPRSWLRFHPDKNPDCRDIATEKFKELTNTCEKYTPVKEHPEEKVSVVQEVSAIKAIQSGSGKKTKRRRNKRRLTKRRKTKRSKSNK